MGLSLEKKSELVRLSLEKRQVPAGIKLAVKMQMDVSGSMQSMFRDGTVQELVDRLIPVAMRFDDNGAIEAYAFSDRVKQIDDITESDFGNSSEKIKYGAGAVLWGGTCYSKALETILDEQTPKRRFMSFTNKAVVTPAYVIFITDGDTGSDEKATDNILASLGDKKTYVQLIGVGRGSSFSFLKDMADKYDHVGFVTFPDLAKTTDSQMYEALLSEELCDWIKKQ